MTGMAVLLLARPIVRHRHRFAQSDERGDGWSADEGHLVRAREHRGSNAGFLLGHHLGSGSPGPFFLEGFQWHGVKRGDAFAFYAGDIRVEGPHPFCSSGGNLGNGRTRTAMYTDSIEQLRGTAGARQVRVRAETALAAFTTPSSGGWIMFGKSPS